MSLIFKQFLVRCSLGASHLISKPYFDISMPFFSPGVQPPISAYLTSLESPMRVLNALCKTQNLFSPPFPIPV